MATVYKRNGVGKYQIDWYDHTGKRRTKSSGTTDKAAAQRIANKLEANVALRVEGVIDVRMDELAKEAARSLKTVLDDYDAAMSSKGSSLSHIQMTRNKIDAIVEAGKFKCLGQSRAAERPLRTAKLSTAGWATTARAADVGDLPFAFRSAPRRCATASCGC